MFFKHIYERGLAHASYIVGCQATGEAIIIDPKRDIDTYLEIAESENLKITKVAETHIHADFLSGSREIAAATGAQLYLSDEGGSDWQYQFDHVGVKDGDTIIVGNLKLDVMHTPGHTPEHISFLLTDTPASDQPIMIFTGDFVFVGDVGRPDLLEKAAGMVGTQEIGARQMFQSLKRFKALPDHVQVWPAHGAGSACGKALGAVPSSTVGYEKVVNWALKIDDEERFVKQLLSGQPEPPKYFAMMKKLNKTGARVLGDLPHPARLTVHQFEEAGAKGLRVIDTREKSSFAAGHFPGSINIQDNNSFSTWAGWLLNYEDPFVLIAPDNRIEDLTRALIRIGLDNTFGYVNDINKLTSSGEELDMLPQLTVQELDAKREEYHLLDVRGTTEYEEGHIAQAQHIHGGYLEDNLDRIPRDLPIVVQCATGNRSSTAASLLASHGFRNVSNLIGGITEWTRQKKATEKTIANQDAVMA
jgi:hydroxyacylglutathione hydrolase